MPQEAKHWEKSVIPLRLSNNPDGIDVSLVQPLNQLAIVVFASPGNGESTEISILLNVFFNVLDEEVSEINS